MNPERTAEIWASMFPCPHHLGTRITPLTCWTRQKEVAPTNGGKPAEALLDPECESCSKGAEIRAQVESGEIILPAKLKRKRWQGKTPSMMITAPQPQNRTYAVREEAVKETVMPKRRPGRPPQRKETEVTAQIAAQATRKTVEPKTQTAYAPWAQKIDPSSTSMVLSVEREETMRCKDPSCRRAGHEIPVGEMARNIKNDKPTGYCQECMDRRRTAGVQAAFDRRPAQAKIEDLFSDYPELWAKLAAIGKKYYRTPEMQLVAMVAEAE